MARRVTSTRPHIGCAPDSRTEASSAMAPTTSTDTPAPRGIEPKVESRTSSLVYDPSHGRAGARQSRGPESHRRASLASSLAVYSRPVEDALGLDHQDAVPERGAALVPSSVQGPGKADQSRFGASVRVALDRYPSSSCHFGERRPGEPGEVARLDRAGVAEDQEAFAVAHTAHRHLVDSAVRSSGGQDRHPSLVPEAVQRLRNHTATLGLPADLRSNSVAVVTPTVGA